MRVSMLLLTLMLPAVAASQARPTTVPQASPVAGESGALHVVRGVVRRPDGQPVAGATVELFETEQRVPADSAGRFVLRTTWRGTALLVARAVGDPPASRELVLPMDSVFVLVLPRGVPRLTAFTVRPPGEFQLAASARHEPLTPLEVVQQPGAAANVSRALQVAPGVNTVDEGTGLFVRGGDVTETRVLVDDVHMISPARFANPTGHVGASLNPFLLSGATLSAGAFGAAFGNALSGVVRLETAGRPAARAGSLSAGLGGASMNAAVPVGRRAGVRALVSMNDLAPLMRTFGAAQPYEPPPRGGDASVTAEFATGRHGRLRLFTVRQRQEFGVAQAHEQADSRYAATTTEQLTVLSWRDTTWRWQPSVSLGRGRFDRAEQLPALALGTALASDHVVATVRRRAGLRLGLTVGLEHERFVARYEGATTEGIVRLRVHVPTRRTGAFGEAVWRMGPSVQLTSGVRGDRSDYTRRTTIDPRVALAVQLRNWGLVGSVGSYHQIPEPILVRAAVADPMRVVQGTFAVERGTPVGARLRVEAYARRWTALSQFTPTFDAVGGGTGEAIGVDGEFRWPMGERSRMRLVWSTLDARRTDARTGRMAPAPMSITHTVTWLTEREIGRLSLGTSLRHATGRPYTNIVGRAGQGSEVQPIYGAPNGERLPAYWRSDVSASWLLLRRRGPTAVVWGALSNVFDRRNVMRYTWDATYTTRTAVRAPFNRSAYVGATLLLP